MSERMTDRDLVLLDVPGIGDDVRMMARELTERRALDKGDAKLARIAELEKRIEDIRTAAVLVDREVSEGFDWATATSDQGIAAVDAATESVIALMKVCEVPA